jgi:hypothetical protein
VKQHCYLAIIYLNWVLLGGALARLPFERHYLLSLTWVMVLPLAKWGYIRVFPSISQINGGVGESLKTAQAILDHSDLETTLHTYTACGRAVAGVLFSDVPKFGPATKAADPVN